MMRHIDNENQFHEKCQKIDDFCLCQKFDTGGRQMFSDFNRKTVLGLSRAISVINGGGF